MQSATERRWQLICKLNSCRKETCANLANEFNVSVTTIRRDIDVLTCSYPIDTKPGKNGYVYLEDWFDLFKQHLTDKQEETLKRVMGNCSEEDGKVIKTILENFSKKVKR